MGATIGDSPNLNAYWNSLVDKFQNKLKSWNAENVSMAVKLVLLKTTQIICHLIGSAFTSYQSQ